jgi:hypothetical protein
MSNYLTKQRVFFHKGNCSWLKNFKLMNDIINNRFVKFQYIKNSPILSGFSPWCQREQFERNECYYVGPVAPICNRNATRQLPIDKDVVLIRFMYWDIRHVIVRVSASPSVQPAMNLALNNLRTLHVRNCLYKLHRIMKNAVLWDIETQFVPHRKHTTSPLQSQTG